MPNWQATSRWLILGLASISRISFRGISSLGIDSSTAPVRRAGARRSGHLPATRAGVFND
jgi:hypothetical protein